MHTYKTYKYKHLNGTESLYSACSICGEIEVKNPDSQTNYCKGKIDSDSTIKVLEMELVK